MANWLHIVDACHNEVRAAAPGELHVRRHKYVPCKETAVPY